jgi:hypothetical protein
MLVTATTWESIDIDIKKDRNLWKICTIRIKCSDG